MGKFWRHLKAFERKTRKKRVPQCRKKAKVGTISFVRFCVPFKTIKKNIDCLEAARLGKFSFAPVRTRNLWAEKQASYH